MPNQFFSPEGDLEYYFADEYWLVDQYVGDTLYAAGENASGQIGVNDLASRLTLTQEFTASTNWKQVSCAVYHVAAIKTDGTLWTWGRNTSGALGDATSVTFRSTPRQISAGANGITGWKQVSAGFDCTAAIRDDGTLWTWGLNSNGQLGDNSLSNRNTPRQISAGATRITTWKQVCAGNDGMAAIGIDGTLWTWGRNQNGQLGDNTNIGKSVPIQIGIADAGGLTGWKKVETRGFYMAALRDNGTLWLWGLNSAGQIGDNTNGGGTATNSRSTPRQEFTLSTNWKTFSCGTTHTSAIKTNGTLWMWGSNTAGKLGDNTLVDRSTPRQEFTASTNWKDVSVNGDVTAATKTNGTLWAWGINAFGQLGDGTLTTRSTPRQEFTSSTNWKQLSVGQLNITAVKAGVELN